MGKIISIFLIFITIKTSAQIANAGRDVTVYLTQTNSVTLNGSLSAGKSFLWREISTDYMSGATITSPINKTTTVTGLPQGVFYFEIAATTGGGTKRDTMAVTVNYSPIPSNANFMVGVPFNLMASAVNDYSDTSGLGNTGWHLPGSGYTIFLDKGRCLDMNIDNQKKKFRSTLEDGWPFLFQRSANYGRAELSYGYGDGKGAPIDSNKTYLIEWKGYFPQKDTLFTTGGNIFGVTVFWQLHGKDSFSPVFQFVIREDTLINGQWRHNISFMESKPAGTLGRTPTDVQKMAMYNDFYDKTHTIRIYLKEGKAGSGNYIKVLLDGKQAYFRNTGDVGRTWQHDYPKFATIYDFDNRLVDNSGKNIASARNRGRKFCLVTESYNQYVLDTTYSSVPHQTF